LIIEYYKKLFGAQVPSFSSMREEVTHHDIPQLEERDIFMSPFTKEEVHEAISKMENNKAPD
jgi:hypothetical protein